MPRLLLGLSCTFFYSGYGMGSRCSIGSICLLTSPTLIIWFHGFCWGILDLPASTCLNVVLCTNAWSYEQQCIDRVRSQSAGAYYRKCYCGTKLAQKQELLFVQYPPRSGHRKRTGSGTGTTPTKKYQVDFKVRQPYSKYLGNFFYHYSNKNNNRILDDEVFLDKSITGHHLSS